MCGSLEDDLIPTGPWSASKSELPDPKSTWPRYSEVARTGEYVEGGLVKREERKAKVRCSSGK